MIVKILNIKTQEEYVFSTDDNHISVQVTPEEFEQIQSMPKTKNGKSIEGRDHRTLAFIRPNIDEMDKLTEWAKS